jgi:predicted nucleic acid-binding Zn ribbon protein
MNCKYCGAALPSKGGTCPNCGKLIPMDQIRERREMLDPRLNEYRDMNTAMYKSNQAYDDNKDKKVGIIIVVIIVLLLALIIIAF